MAETLGRNIVFPIYVDDDGEQKSFHDLVLRKATVDSVVMSLSDKITGDVLYKDNTLTFSMQEYVIYNNVKYYLVNPPTVVREGMVSNNNDLKGMTKYSFEFYHPMWMLSNFPFSDVAVSSDEELYLSQNKTFNWIGNIKDFVAKLNKNLQCTEWVVVLSPSVSGEMLTKLSEVLSFDNNFISDALKMEYDTWGLSYIIDSLHEGEYYTDDEKPVDYYSTGKRFVIVIGNPTNEIHDYTEATLTATDLASDGKYYAPTLLSLEVGKKLSFKSVADGASPLLFSENLQELDFDTDTSTYIPIVDTKVYVGATMQYAAINVWYNYDESPFIFRFGQGVGLKNNSRTPRNNKIITRIAGYGSEDNIPYGYPQIKWTGDPNWNYTLKNSAGMQEYADSQWCENLVLDANFSNSYWSKTSPTPKITLTIADGEAVVVANSAVYGNTFGISGITKGQIRTGHIFFLSYYCYLQNEHEMGGSAGTSEIPSVKVAAGAWTLVSGITTQQGTDDTVTLKPLSEVAIGETIRYKAVVCIDLTASFGRGNETATAAEVLETLQPYTTGGKAKEGRVGDLEPLMAMSYPIYDGIMGGEKVRLIKHPFTRTHLMPSIYEETVNAKVNPKSSEYDPTIEIVDYYDASGIAPNGAPYPNQINLAAPSFEVHSFEDIKPELGEAQIISATPLDKDLKPATVWDDTMDDDGNYVQSYFKIKLPKLTFDLYACAAITQEMSINMRGGACIGCTFPVQVDWDDYKKSFYDSNGNFAPDGSQRDLKKYPKSNLAEIEVIVEKETETFGTLMPNVYQQPKEGDSFVILGISLPYEYITAAQKKLDGDMGQYMLENNVHYFDYPLKFDEFFLVKHAVILKQIRPNSVIRFDYAGGTLELFVKQLTIKYGDKPLPEYSITLTDEIEVVLNQIGQVVEGLTQLGSQVSSLRSLYGTNAINSLFSEIETKLSRVSSDIARGIITFMQGIVLGASYRIDADGIATLSQVKGNLGELTAVQSADFNSGDAFTGGAGYSIASNPTSHVSDMEIDNLLVRRKATFTELELRKLSAVGGNIVLSAASSTIMAVENTADGVYRCHLNADDGTMATQNNWELNDIVRCQTFNVESGRYTGVSNKNYYGFVSDKGEDSLGKWIEITQSLVDGSAGVVEVGDVIVQFGNRDINTDRCNVIVLGTSGSNAPYFMQYRNVNDYALTDEMLLTQYSPQGNIVRAKSISIETAQGNYQRVANDRGAYSSEVVYEYYDRVSYNGSLWLYINTVSAKGQTPTTGNTAYWLQQVAKGSDGLNSNTISVFFEQPSFVVPANSDGTPDSTFFQAVKYHVYKGGAEVTRNWVAAIYSCTGAQSMINSSQGELVLSGFTEDGKCVIELRSETETDILYATVGYVVIQGGVDAISMHIEDSAIARTLGAKAAYTSILPLTTRARMYRGSQNVSLNAQWSIVADETTGCSAALSSADDYIEVRVNALTSDYAHIVVSATYGSITLKKTIDVAISRNGVNGVDGTNGTNGIDGENGRDGENAVSCVLSQSSAVVGMDYNEASTPKVKVSAIVSKGSRIISSGISYFAETDGHCTVTYDDTGVTIAAINNFGEGYDFPIYVYCDGATFALHFRYEIVTAGFKAQGTEASMYAKYVDANGNVQQAKVGTVVEDSGETVVKMGAGQIELEGYTTINGATRIDEQGTLITKNAILEGYLRSAVSVDMWSTSAKYLIEDKLNIMTNGQKSCSVWLPVDPKYVGARLIIIAGVNAINTGEINGGLKYTQIGFDPNQCLSDDNATEDDIVFAARNANLWLLGGKLFDDGKTPVERYYCPDKMQIKGGGSVELLGVESNVHYNGNQDNDEYYTQWVVVNTNGSIQYGRGNSWIDG